MLVKITKEGFQYSLDTLTVTDFPVGEHDLPEIVAECAIKHGYAEAEEKKKRGKYWLLQS